MKVPKKFKGKFSVDTFWLGLAQIVLIASGFLLNFLIGYFRGADELGVYSQSVAIYNIVAVVAGLGLNNNLLNKIPSGSGEKSEISSLLGQNLAITLIFSIVLMILITLVAYYAPAFFSSRQLASVLLFNALALPLYALNRNIMAYFGALRKQLNVAKVRLIRWGSLLGFTVIGLVFHAKLEYLILSFLGSELLVFIFSLQWIQMKISGFNFDGFWLHIAFGSQSLISEILSISNSRSEVLILGYTLSNAEVGVYSFFILFVRVLYVFPGILMQNLNPIISKYWAKGKITALSRVMRKIFKQNLLIGLAGSGVVVFGYWFVTKSMGVEFQSSLIHLVIALIGTYLFSTVAFAGSALVMMGKLKANMIRTSILLILTLASTYFLSSWYGLMGAAWAVSIMGLLSGLILLEYVQRQSKIRII